MIGEGEVVTDQQVLDDDGDNLTIDAGGILDVADDAILADGNDVIIENAGAVTAGSDGIESNGDDARITNSGSIRSNSAGIESSGNDAQITNNGSIAAEAGIRSTGVNVQITNSGSITPADSDGIRSTGANAQITNSGSIATVGTDGIESNGNNAQITNSGQIFVAGGSGAAIEMTGDSTVLTNTGLLSSTNSAGFAIEGGAGTQTVTLGAGSQIIGAIDLGAGEDRLDIAAGNASAVLAFVGVETLNLDDDLAFFATDDGITTVDTTGISVLNEAVGALSNSAHAEISGRFAPVTDLATQGTVAPTSGAWASLFGQARNVGDDGAALAYSHNFAGLIAGYDRDTSAGRVGFVGGVSAGHIETDADSQDTDTESLFAGAYLNRSFDQVHLTGSVLAGVGSYDSDRLVIDNLAGFETATARFDSQFVSASVNAATQAFMLGNVALTPSVTATYTAVNFDGYTEDGTTSANLEVDDRSAQTLKGRAELTTRYLLGSVDTAFRGGIDARTSFEDDISATLDGITADFDVSDSDNYLGGFVGTRAVFSQSAQFSVVGDLEYQFGENETDAVAAGLNVSFSF